MQPSSRIGLFKVTFLVGAAVVVGIGIRALPAAAVPGAMTRSFEFPVSLGSAVSGDLVSPPGASPALTFSHGNVAVGVLPVPVPQALARRRLLRNRQPFFLPSADGGPHARLLLSGVVDSNGQAANNSGNQLVIDAVVSPADAAMTTPPFVIPFDINNGMAFVDAALPIRRRSDGPVSVQVTGVSVNDADGLPFGVLGFLLAPVHPTPTPRATPTPGGTPSSTGRCFVGPSCIGPSFPAARDLCCAFVRPNAAAALATSWCPPDQFDPQTGQCAADACVACGAPLGDCGDRPTCDGKCTVTCADGHVASGLCQNGPSCSCAADCTLPPTPTPAPTRTPGPCDTTNSCGGACPYTCADGSTVTGECTLLLTPEQPRGPICACEGHCPQPPTPTPGPCDSSTNCSGTCPFTCPDGTTVTGKCLGLPISVVGPGRNACGCFGECGGPPPTIPPLPRGTICCQCDKTAANKCFDIHWVEVTPICPPGCSTVMNGTCDPSTNACSPPQP